MKSILDSPEISNRAFYPRSYELPNVQLIELSGTTLAYHQTEIDSEALTLIHFHGNGEIIADYVNGEFHRFYDLGVNVVFVEYRGYGQAFGTPQLVEMLEDGEQLIAALGLPAEKVVAMGRSMGSLYAIELAARQPSLAGLVIESGIHDLADRLMAWGAGKQFPVDQVYIECRKHFNHTEKLADYSGPILLLHAERDHIIDFSHAERNHEANPARSKLVQLPHGDHNSVMPLNADLYFSELQQFLNQCR